MKKLSIILSSLTLAAVAGLFFSSCTSTTSPSTGIGAPSNLMALSKDQGSISIEWTRASGDTAVDTIIVSTLSPVVTSNSATSYTIPQLSTGTVYTITVASSGGRSSSITWMTAHRTPAAGTSPLRIYQYSGSGSSGLILNGAAGTAQVVSLKNDPTASTTIDFILDDSSDVNSKLNGVSTIVSPTGMTFEAAQAYDNTWKHSWISTDAHYVVGGLDNDWSATDYSSVVNAITAITDETMRGDQFLIPSDNGYTAKGSRVLLILTADGHFAKVEIVAQSDGRLYGGTWPNQYVDVNVSYQAALNENYASRPHHINYGAGRAPRVSVQ